MHDYSRVPGLVCLEHTRTSSNYRTGLFFDFAKPNVHEEYESDSLGLRTNSSFRRSLVGAT